MFTISRFRLSLVAAATMVAPSAFAGGYVSPVEPAPIVAPAVQTTSSWVGAYAGLGLGYAFGGDDRVGVRFYEDGEIIDRADDLTNLKIKGWAADARLGYRWQRGNMVFGPELSIDGGSIDDSHTELTENTVPLPGEPLMDRQTIESSMNYAATLALKAGYLVRPDTMVYGSAGYSRGDFDYKIAINDSSVTEGFDADGYSVGLGVEHKINDRMSVFGEYNYRNYGKTDVALYSEGGESLVTRATPEHSMIKMGVNFSF